VCISWKIKCWILLMHGVTMKFKNSSLCLLLSPSLYLITNSGQARKFSVKCAVVTT